MPKRSNDFQRLVTLLHRVLAPEGAVVTESNMVRLILSAESKTAYRPGPNQSRAVRGWEVRACVTAMGECLHAFLWTLACA